MNCYSTTMNNLLQDIKLAVKTEVKPGLSLRSIKQVKIGGIRNPMAFPIIAVVPVEESPYQIMNGVIDNIRVVRVECYAHKLNSKSAMRAAMGTMEAVKKIFQVNANSWQIPRADGDMYNTVYDTLIGEINPANTTQPYRNGLISMASVEIICYSRDDINPDVGGTSVAEFIYTDAKSLIDTIASTYKRYSTGVNDVLSSTKSFKSFTLPPNPVYPILFIGIDDEFEEHKFAGRDSTTRLIEIHVLNKMLKQETSLLKNMKTADYCRQILFANKHFEGRAAHFNYLGIIYGQLGSEGTILYGSSIRFEIESYENLSTPN